MENSSSDKKGHNKNNNDNSTISEDKKDLKKGNIDFTAIEAYVKEFLSQMNFTVSQSSSQNDTMNSDQSTFNQTQDSNSSIAYNSSLPINCPGMDHAKTNLNVEVPVEQP